MPIERLTRIEAKVDKIVDRIGSVDGTLKEQHISLQEHMRRTEILESQIKPIERHIVMVQGAMKLIGIIAFLGTILGGLAEFLMYLRDLPK